MLSESHSLIDELPDHKHAIGALKEKNNHFARLYGEYDSLNKEILRIEKGAEAASDERLENLKKERLARKDEMMKMIEGFEA
ncbi:MAG: DUF465 domain-containing protein [Alphaproteobacteria bacterium]|nr:DUF465 domain-containing protein [Alphaproteobacteria bacterium]MCB9974668.1 DUF465 domain-containing protein [Rhodospirillales bacterium]